MHIDRTTAKEAVRLLKNYRELIETSKALAEIFGRIRAKCADMAKDEKDANGREHMPAGTPAGGQFTGTGGGGRTTPEERRKKIESVKIDFDRDNILPELNKEDLAEIGKTQSKPVLLKKGVIDRNAEIHPEIERGEYDYLIGAALYDSNNKFKGFKDNYINFIKKISDESNSLVLLEMAETKDNYEIVHIIKLNDSNLKRMMKKSPK